MFPKVFQIFCVLCVDNTRYLAYVCFHAGLCSEMQYSVPGIWWDTKGRCVCRCAKVLATHSTCVDDVEYSEMCWCVMHGHIVKHLEMVDMCAGHFRVWECKGIEGIWMVLKTSKVCKCQNVQKWGSTCVEKVHTHHHPAIYFFACLLCFFAFLD